MEISFLKSFFLTTLIKISNQPSKPICRRLFAQSLFAVGQSWFSIPFPLFAIQYQSCLKFYQSISRWHLMKVVANMQYEFGFKGRIRMDHPAHG